MKKKNADKKAARSLKSARLQSWCSTMSYNQLNVEKLMSMFNSLTRSRESIQSTSSWILSHSEFFDEIVPLWSHTLNEGRISPLLLFYVANDIILHCGKKRCPQFRPEFQKILLKAVSLPQVRQIRAEVTRMLVIWRERMIYEDDFFNRLKLKLDSDDPEPEETLPPRKSLTEEELLKLYKREELQQKLINLESIEKDLEEKMEILMYADEPESPDIEELIVKNECRSALRTFTVYQRAVMDCVSLVEKELEAREELIEQLELCSNFHDRQFKDVKTVAGLFRTYGKKLDTMKEKVSEKLNSFPDSPEPSSPEETADENSAPNLGETSHSSNSNEILDSTKDNNNVISPQVADPTVEDSMALASSNISQDDVSCHLNETLSASPILEKESSFTPEEKTSECSSENISKSGDASEVDLMHEQTYDTKKTKTRDMKRKIQLLLKSKEKKQCTDQTREESLKDSSPIVDKPQETEPEPSFSHSPDCDSTNLSSVLNSESQSKASENEEATKSYVEDMAAPSTSNSFLDSSWLAAGISTDVLKDILKRNLDVSCNQNTTSNPQTESLNIIPPTELESSALVTGLSTDAMPKADVTPSEASMDFKENCTFYLAPTDSLQTKPEVEGTEVHSHAVIPRKQEQDTKEPPVEQLKTENIMKMTDKIELKASKVEENKPDLLQTMGGLLQYLSQNLGSTGTVKVPPSISPSLGSVMPLDKYLKIYAALCCKIVSKLKSNSDEIMSSSNDHDLQGNVKQPVGSCNVSLSFPTSIVGKRGEIKDNLGVMDMDCDSDG